MTKPYLLIVGDNYYPARGTGDWVACYATEEEAKEQWKELSKSKYNNDWHKIVDLREWMEDTTSDAFGSTGWYIDTELE